MDYAKQYQEYLARANQALEKACETFPGKSGTGKGLRDFFARGI